MATVLGLRDLSRIGWPVFEIPSPRCSRGNDDEDEDGGIYCPTAIYRPFVDKALKQMGLRKLILRLHKLMDPSLQRSRAALLSHMPAQEVRERELPYCFNVVLYKKRLHTSRL
jgi:hypothetical protein